MNVMGLIQLAVQLEPFIRAGILTVAQIRDVMRGEGRTEEELDTICDWIIGDALARKAISEREALGE